MVAPETVEVGPHVGRPARIEAVEPPRTLRVIADETGLLQDLEVLRHCGPADRQPPRELPHGHGAVGQQRDDVAAPSVTQRIELLLAAPGAALAARSGVRFSDRSSVSSHER